MREQLRIYKEDIPFVIFFLSAFLYVLYPFRYDEGFISADAVFDAHIAMNLLRGDGLGWQATLQPPFQAMLTALIYSLTENILVSGILVSKLMWWLLPLPVYILAKDLFNSKIALIAALLVFSHPHFGFSAGMMEPTTTYPALLTAAICLLWRGFSKGNSFYSILSGLFFAAAYLSRSEGLLILIFLILGLFYHAAREAFQSGNTRKLTALLIVVAMFLLSSLPYLLFLKDTYGKWTISPKSTYVQIWMKWRIYHDNDLGEQSNPELWGLSKNGKLMWQEPKGAGDLISYLMSNPEKNIRVYLENFSRQIPGRIPNNSGQWLYPQVYPWYFVIPAIFWIIVCVRKKEGGDKALFLTSPFAILMILPIFSDGWWKYLLPYSPFLIIMAAAGMSEFLAGFRWKEVLLPVSCIIIVVYSLWTVKASALVKHGDRGVASRISMAEEQKRAGEWAQERFKGTPNYMVQWSKMAYYLNGRWTAMPVADYNGMVWYARKNNVDYLVFETSGKGESEQLAGILGNTPDLEVADIYANPSNSYGVLFLRLRK